jgi:hypothetical protein
LGKGHAQHTFEAERYAAMKKDVGAIFGEPWRDDHGVPVLNGERMPGLEAAVAEMYSLEEHGKGIYGLFSNFTHPTLYTISRLWGTVTEGAETIARLQLEIEDHEQRAQYAVVAFYNAFAGTMLYHGWSSELHDSLVADINRVLPGAVNDPTPDEN